VQNVIGILIGIVLNMYIAFGNIAIFIMLILPIHEHRSSFHLLMSSISLFSGLYFSLKRSLIFFFRFIPKYFIVFEAIVNRIVSLISFSVCSLLVYRKATDFCMIILYLGTLLKSF
jgi:hypothetical protein